MNEPGIPGPSVGQSLAGTKPVGWVVRAENGNVILWGTRSEADKAAEKYGRPVEPLYVGPAPVPVAYALVIDGECEEIGWGPSPLPDDPANVLLYASPSLRSSTLIAGGRV